MYSEKEYARKKPNAWVSKMRLASDVQVVMYCFPYAGGDISIYRNWQNQLPSFIEVCPIKLPGRGERLAEPPLTEIPALAEEIADAINGLSTKPYCFFGHSMGALLAFEVARVIQRQGGVMPVHMVASGCAAPHVREPRRMTYHLPDQEFLSEVRELNGAPPEFFDYSELVSLLLPMLRADFQACETYTYQSGKMLDVDMTVLGGEYDSDISMSQLNAWRELTNGRIRLDTFGGDHFFLREFERDVLSIITAQLDAIISCGSDREIMVG